MIISRLLLRSLAKVLFNCVRSILIEIYVYVEVRVENLSGPLPSYGLTNQLIYLLIYLLISHSGWPVMLWYVISYMRILIWIWLHDQLSEVLCSSDIWFGLMSLYNVVILWCLLYNVASCLYVLLRCVST